MPGTATAFRRTVVSDPASASCLYQPESSPSGWCIDYAGPNRSRAGVPVDLSVEVCRIRGLAPGALHFDTEREADIGIDDSTHQWRWSHGRRFADTAHVVTVPSGQCLRWTTRWTTEDNSGRLLSRGSYWLDVEVLSDDTDLPNTSTASSTKFKLT
jgi:hypothetical protein